MSKIDEHEVKHGIFIDNTSFLLSSVFGLTPKIFCNDKDSTKLKSNLHNYLRFTIAVKSNNISHRMLFIVSSNTKDLQLMQCPSVPTLCSQTFSLGDKEDSLLMNFWYNIAAIYMFSFLDSIDCIGDSLIYNDLPTEISRSECLAYFASDEVSVVMGVSGSTSNNDGGIMYIGMLS